MIIQNQSNITYNYLLPDGQTESGEENSNIVNTEILTYSVPKVKSGDKTFLREGETSVHSVVITNNSQTKLFNMTFKDAMSDGATYVPGSVAVNGVSQPTYDPIAGFVLPDLEVGQSIPITYTIKANDPLTQTSVTNFATLNYTVYDPERGNVNLSENTNTVFVKVISDRITAVDNPVITVIRQTPTPRSIVKVFGCRCCDCCCSPCNNCRAQNSCNNRCPRNNCFCNFCPCFFRRCR